MKHLIFFLLLSFSTTAQDSTWINDSVLVITLECDKTRQQIRKEFNLKELQERNAENQHKRENAKEIKSLRFDKQSLRRKLTLQDKANKIKLRTFRIESKQREDSIKQSGKLLLNQERNRNSEKEKILRNEKKAAYNESKIEIKRLKKEKRELLLWGMGVLGVLLLIITFCVIKLRIKRN